MTFSDEVRNYVNKSHANAWRRAGVKVPDEPALVSPFLSRDMYRGLCKILKTWRGGLTTTVTGIFTHQTPKVRLITQKQSTEIADLMLVHQHLSVTGGLVVSTRGNALLLQAKRTGTPATGSVASGTAALQFELYRDWAPFVGTSRLPSAPVGGTHWNFRNGLALGVATPLKEGAYLTVFDQQAFSVAHFNPQWAAPISPGPAHTALASFPASCTWSQGYAPTPGSSASGGVACPTDFGTAFVEFLDGRRGRSFTPGITAGPDHWSIFVNMMMQVSANSSSYPYNSSNQGIQNAPRGRTLLFESVAPLLGHVAFEELSSFISRDSQRLGDPFHLTNLLIRTIGAEAQDGSNDRPSYDGPYTYLEGDDSGHPPMLLVVTSDAEGWDRE